MQQNDSLANGYGPPARLRVLSRSTLPPPLLPPLLCSYPPYQRLILLSSPLWTFNTRHARAEGRGAGEGLSFTGEGGARGATARRQSDRIASLRASQTAVKCLPADKHPASDPAARPPVQGPWRRGALWMASCTVTKAGWNLTFFNSIVLIS